MAMQTHQIPFEQQRYRQSLLVQRRLSFFILYENGSLNNFFLTAAAKFLLPFVGLVVITNKIIPPLTTLGEKTFMAHYQQLMYGML